MKKESTYLHDYTKKQAAKNRARTQLPKRKTGKTGDTSYHKQFKRYKIEMGGNDGADYGKKTRKMQKMTLLGDAVPSGNN
jgi:hypothetical protein